MKFLNYTQMGQKNSGKKVKKWENLLHKKIYFCMLYFMLINIILFSAYHILTIIILIK